MGLSDRDYTREDFPSGRQRRLNRSSGGWSVVLVIIFINFALWIANGFLSAEVGSARPQVGPPAAQNAENNVMEIKRGADPNWLTKLLMLQMEYVGDISSCYRFLTYGFVHDYTSWTHIAFNMFGLLMFGYGLMLGIGPGGFGFVRGENVESRLGGLEFTAFYMVTIIVGGIVFALTNFSVADAACLGASGGVCGVVILYAWLFPRKTLLLYGIIPLPMWAIGVLIVFMDAYGAAGGLWQGIGYSVHLAGAAFGTLYYFLFFRRGIRLTDWLDTFSRPVRKPKVWIRTSEDFTQDLASESSLQDDEFDRRLDAILKRYGEVGESGLTADERKFLQQASKRFAEKHKR